MDKERFLTSGLIEQYVLGLTTPEETEEVERYVEAFPEIQAEIDALRKSIERYAEQYAIHPPDQLKRKILSEIETAQNPKSQQYTPSKNPIDKPLRRLRLQMSVVMLAAIAATVWSFWHQNQLKGAYQELASQFTTLQNDCDELRRQYTSDQEVIAFVKHTDTKVVHLHGTAIDPEAHVIVYWNTYTHEAYLSMVNMQALPEGKQYQIWADVDGVMIESALLAKDVTEWHPIKVIDRAESLNITIEPLGGSEHPTVTLLVANGKV
ncbi:MAG: anti-sigma factor [Saprospiraceae bacterium]|nr:anti-sigma factor [Saprospiraceae bacterium]